MIPNDDLLELQAEFEPVRVANQRHHRDLEKLRLRFTKLFPRSRIPQLTLDEFVQGKRSKDSFCYWVERETTDLGHIQGAPSTKFGIYYSKKKNGFQFTKKFGSETDARTRVLKQITELLDAARRGDVQALRDSPISPMFKGKILFLYFPERFINIFSERHVDHFLSRLRLNTPGSKLDLISKKELFTEFKNKDDVMKDWTTFEFSDFLYWAWPPPSRDATVPAKLKNYILTFPAPEDTIPDFINLQAGVVTNSSTTGAGGNGGGTDFDKKNRRNKLTGNQGEDVVFLAEKIWLQKNGKHSLAKRVEAVCKSNDGAGYDILSFELDGREKPIEVKSTISKAPAPGANFKFYLSANEYEQARKIPNFHLYIVFDVKSKKPQIWPIPKPTSLEPKRLLLKPSAYYATLTIA
jgi:hypothetical protein